MVEDDDAVLTSYRLVLRDCIADGDSGIDSGTNDLAGELFGDNFAEDEADRRILEEVVYCTQGFDGVRAVEQSISEGKSFSVAFIDMRMPPGIDGLETAKRIRAIDPHINIVIVTAFSDHVASKVAEIVAPPDKLFYLAKPFEPMEIQQLASALSHKWVFESSLERTNEHLTERCAELERMNAKLTATEAIAI